MPGGLEKAPEPATLPKCDFFSKPFGKSTIPKGFMLLYCGRYTKKGTAMKSIIGKRLFTTAEEAKDKRKLG